MGINCQWWVGDYDSERAVTARDGKISCEYYFGLALTASDGNSSEDYYFGSALTASGGNFNGDYYFGQALTASTGNCALGGEVYRRGLNRQRDSPRPEASFVSHGFHYFDFGF